MPNSVIILAAGAGTRMRSQRPKVLHCLAGRPILEHIIHTVESLNVDNTFVVYGHGGEQVPDYFSQLTSITWIKQTERLGTGHAVQQVLPHISDDHNVLILNGDGPLITQSTLQQALANVTTNAMSLVTADFENPYGLGRIIRDTDDAVIAIVEEKDADAAQKNITEINSGIMAVNAIHLRNMLDQIKNDNQQQEYYLTDIIALSVAAGKSVIPVKAAYPEEVAGINDRQQLAALERFYQKKQADLLLQQGVALYDPARIDIRGSLTVGQDVTIDINVIFEGDVVIGDACEIGPNVVIKNCVIGDHVKIKANSLLEQSHVGDHCDIGPFARLRPGTQLAEQAKVGNFVETKKTIVGRGSKINHLSYIGDANIGENVNIGAGTITCNYDGFKKHMTQIADEAFIGSGTQLVAPVNIGKKATIGAGSTISQDASAGALTLSRARQRTIDKWVRPIDKKGR